jgi:parallel beta-helix repeat protein
MYKRLIVAILIAFFSLHLYAQAHIDPGIIEKQIFVNVLHPDASDSNMGTDPGYPLKSLSKALAMSKNIPSRITVFPGHYREYLDIYSNQLLIIEAYKPGTVFISGSDVFSSKKRDSLIVVAWPYDFGYFDDSDFCFGPCNMTDTQRRREILFINGEPYEQITTFDSLSEGRFLVDEVNNEVLIFPDAAAHLNDPEIEISVRAYDIYDMGRNGSLVTATVYEGSGLILKGLTFEHAANIAHQGCLSITHTDNLFIEDCKFQWNNGVGLELEDCSHVTIKNTLFRHNGQRGMGVGHGENLLLQNLEIYGNNWRMNADKMISHDAAGVKIFGSTKNVVLDNIHAYNNYCSAIWFDWNNTNYRIQNSLIENNQETGIMLEGSRKPAFVENCVVRNNDVGIKGYGHANVTIDSCTVYGNNIQLSLGQDGRIVQQDDDWEINSRDWRIFYSSFLATERSQSIMYFFEYHNPHVPSSYAATDFFETVNADYNTFYHPTKKNIFPDGNSLSDTPLTLNEWQKITKQDQNSVFRNDSSKRKRLSRENIE